jgi:hypothetical protein
LTAADELPRRIVLKCHSTVDPALANEAAGGVVLIRGVSPGQELSSEVVREPVLGTVDERRDDTTDRVPSQSRRTNGITGCKLVTDEIAAVVRP